MTVGTTTPRITVDEAKKLAEERNQHAIELQVNSITAGFDKYIHERYSPGSWTDYELMDKDIVLAKLVLIELRKRYQDKGWYISLFQNRGYLYFRLTDRPYYIRTFLKKLWNLS